MKKLLLLIIGLLLITPLISQQRHLKFKIKGLQKDSAVYLGNYLGKSLYYFDTAYVKKKGVVEFKTKKEVPAGVYALIVNMKPVSYFEFIVNEDKILIKGDATANDASKLRESIKVKKSEENKIFYNYISFLDKQSKAKQPLLEKNSDKEIAAEEKEKISKQIQKIDQEVIDYQKNLIENNKDKYVGKLIAMSMEPDPIKIPEGITDSAMYRYMHYRNHYWDKMDLKDDALARTPIFHQRLDNYFLKVIPQDPDTIINEIIKLTDKMNEPGDLFKYTVNHLTYAHVKTKRMGMDKVYFRMIEKYYIPGRTPWVSEKQINKMKDDVNKLKNVLVGNFAPNIILLDTSETKYVSLYKDVSAKYTILYFWDWTCGHCKKETPKLKEFYDSIKKNTDIDIEVYAVCTKEDNTGWIPFIKKHNLDWINVSDPADMIKNAEKYGMEIKEINGKETLLRNDYGVTINYRSTYDVYVTPQIFLLDKNKKIIAKQLAVEQLPDIITQLEKMKN